MNDVVRLRPDGDPVAGMKPSSFAVPGSFTGADETELNHSFFENGDQSLLVGVWQCAPCLEEVEAYAVNELMHVLSGSVTVTRADGTAETFTAGDTFFIPKGTRCTWHITETLRKYYMISA